MKQIIYLLILLLNFSTIINASDVDVLAQDVEIENAKEKLDYIKVSSAPEEVSKISIELKKIDENIKEKDEIVDIHKQLPPYIDSISLLLKEENYQNLDKQNTRELQKMQSEISIYLEKLNSWEEMLKVQIVLYDTNKNLLSDYLILWDKTYKNAIENDAPKNIVKSIKSEVNKIKNISNKLKENYDETLTDSQIITTNILSLKEIIKKIKDRELVTRTEIFSKEQPSLSTLVSDNKLDLKHYMMVIKNTFIEKIHVVKGYFKIDSRLFNTLMFITFLNLLLNTYIFRLYRKRKLFVKEGSYNKKIFYFIKRPISTFVMLFTLSLLAVYSTRPTAVNDMIFIILLIPTIRILQTIVKKEYYKVIYLFLAIYIMFFIDRNSSECELESRLFLMLINILLLVFIGWLLSKKVLQFSSASLLIKIEKFILILFSAMLFFSLLSNLYGNALLSMRIVDGVLTSMYTSLTFYVLYIVLTGYIVIIFRRRVATASNLLEIYSRHVENTLKFFIKIWIVIWWFIVLMKFLGVYTSLVEFKNYIFSLSWQISNTTVSIQSIFDFMLIVFITWALSRFLKTFLEVEVFSRFKFPRGVPTAILTTMNYIIVISGTIIAFSSLGISAQQFAIVFGALGVGIGFGLRNIIANFVSGIIMVFERPVQIGDTIEVDGTMGSVLSIGARSSTVKTFDGAEVIIPNADFMAKEIVNWTLSDKCRRKTFEFKVALDNDIEEILAIMQKIASQNMNTLTDPAPIASFQGFEDYYMKFKLYYWLTGNLIETHSDISIALYQALKEAKIKMPVPRTYIDKNI